MKDVSPLEMEEIIRRFDSLWNRIQNAISFMNFNHNF